MGLLIVLVVLSAAMLAPGLLVGPTLDAAVFNHVGGRLLEGAAPYLDSWDHKPPGIYLASAGAQAILGWFGPWGADWLLSLASTVGAGLAIAAVLTRLGVVGWPRSLAAIGATVFASNYFVALGGGLTEPVATALIGVSLVIAIRPTGRRAVASAGGILGMSLLVSPQVLPGAALVMGLVVGLQPPRLRVTRGALFAGAVGIPLAAAAGWLLVIGALPASLDEVVRYSAAYSAASAGFGANLGPPVAARTFLLGSYLIVPSVLGAASLVGPTPMWRGVVLGCLFWVGGSAALIVLQGHFYAHYAIPLSVPIGILAGLGLNRTRGILAPVRPAAQRLVIVLGITASLAVSVPAAAYAAVIQIAFEADQSTRLQAVAVRLRDLPAGSLLVWGNKARLYDVTGRPAATRYIYFLPLTTPGYATAAMIEDLARQLAAHPPEIVVDAGSDAPGAPGFLPLLIPRSVLTDGRDLDLLDPLRAFVAEDYQLVSTVAGWPIYVFRPGKTHPP
jgi:hypothetical protein